MRNFSVVTTTWQRRPPRSVSKGRGSTAEHISVCNVLVLNIGRKAMNSIELSSCPTCIIRSCNTQWICFGCDNYTFPLESHSLAPFATLENFECRSCSTSLAFPTLLRITEFVFAISSSPRALPHGVDEE